jgi:hypothetical protein
MIAAVAFLTALALLAAAVIVFATVIFVLSSTFGVARRR